MKVAAWFTFVLALVWAAAAPAQEAVFNKPIYDPASKSYFELVVVTPEQRQLSARKEQEVRWEIAALLAAKRSFKGVQGRLAVVRTREVHQFLLEKFRAPNFTWIGAAYYCKAHQLRWTDGQLHRKTDFQAWDPNWNQAGVSGCVHGGGHKAGYMPIAYSGLPDGFRWIAKGAAKEYKYYFVEYPTGKP